MKIQIRPSTQKHEELPQRLAHSFGGGAEKAATPWWLIDELVLLGMSGGARRGTASAGSCCDDLAGVGSTNWYMNERRAACMQTPQKQDDLEKALPNGGRRGAPSLGGGAEGALRH